MRLLFIAIFCVVMFFPTYWALHAIVGQEWTAWVALVLTWLVLPYFLLKKWSSPVKHPVLVFGNYLLAILVLGFSLWVAYSWLVLGQRLQGSPHLLWIYFFCSIYYLSQGHMPYQKNDRDT